MRQCACRLIVLFLFAISPLIHASSVAADAPPLHARIDALLESAALGPLPPQADDAEFLRRVYLDLVGVIPTAAETRAFLDDKSADKRTKLIDQLLGDPRYACWLSTTFDVTLMERRPEKVVKAAEWQDYLYRAIAENRPYNVLVREILSAGSADNQNPPASRFLLDRDVEPNLVTRDVGRLFFGMDLQCAQCHDHPLIDDYYQADYYGIYAFINRTFLFTDKKDKKAPKYLAEKADGETSFKSVFTSQGADAFLPRLPKEPAIAEPVVAKGEEYLVKPEKDERPVPKYSRRQMLAELIGKGENVAFNRNIANRLWAHMFGRGIVHPVDFMHSDNPPSQPELLGLLASEFRAHKYDIKWFLRELAMTRAYQRSSQLPDPSQIKFETVSAKLKELEAEQAKCQVDVDATSAEVEKIAKVHDGLKTPAKTPEAELARLDAVVKAAIAAREKAMKESQDARNVAKAKDDALKLLNDAVAANQALIDKLPGDKVAVDAARQIIERQKQVHLETVEAKNKLATFAKTAQESTDQATKAEQALATAKNPPPPTSGDKEKLTAALVATRNAAAEAKTKLKDAESRVSHAKALVAFQQLMKGEKAAAERAWNSIIETWSANGYVTTLKPLAPEQFGLSLMQATGLLEVQRVSNARAIDKEPPEELAKADDEKKAAIKTELVERKIYDRARGSLSTIINLYGGQPGQDFAATLNQSLFFGNGPLVASFLNPQAGQLIDRLAKQSDVRELSEDLYLSMFTRRPVDQEIAAVADYLKDRNNDRVAAIQEVAWALLASNEFRFNH